MIIKVNQNKSGKFMSERRNFEKTQITIQDGTISRVHAEFYYKADGDLFITDLSSANGTYIDGAQIEAQKQIKVNVNSKINLGDSKFFLSIAECEPEIEAQPIQEKSIEKEKEENKVINRERSRSRSGNSYSPAEKDRRRKSREREDKSRRHKKSEEKGVDRHREKYRRRSKSNQRWKKSKSILRRQSRSRSRSRQYSRKYITKDYSKQNIISDKDLRKNSSEIQNDNPKDNAIQKNSSIHEDDKKDSYVCRKQSHHQENKNSIDEKLTEEIERKKKFLNEFLRVKESQSTDLKLKLPKLIEKEKVTNLNETQNESTVKPNLSHAFKKLEETDRLKGIANQSIGYTRNGNNHINIDRRESTYNYRRIDSYHDSRNRNYSNASTWGKSNY